MQRRSALLTSVTLVLALSGGLAASVFLAPNTVSAQENLEAAKARYKEGRAAYTKGEFAQAIARFEEAYAAKPNAKLLLLIANCYDRLGKPDKAFSYLKRYAQTSSAARTEVKKKLDALKHGMEITARNNAAARVADAVDMANPLMAGKTHTPREVEVVKVFNDVPVLITSEPPGAKVYIDDKEWGVLGVTPFNTRMFPGTHKVWLEKEYFQTAETEVEVKDSKKGVSAKDVRVQLSKSAVPVEIKTFPATAEIMLIDDQGNKKTLGRGHFKGVVPAGPCKFIVESPAFGLRSYEETISTSRLKPGETALFLDYDLRSSGGTVATSLAQDAGTLEVSGYLIDAEVFVDGKSVGVTPGPVSVELSAGTHRVELRKEGYVPHSETLNVAAGTVTKFTTPETLVKDSLDINWTGVALTTVGVAAAGAGAYFTITAMGHQDDADAIDLPSANDTSALAVSQRAEHKDLTDKADQANLISYIAYGVGGAALIGGGLAFVLSADGSAALNDPETPTWRFAGVPLPGGGAVSLGASW